MHILVSYKYCILIYVSKLNTLSECSDFRVSTWELGGTMHVFCGLIQYGKLAGITVGYTITSSTSLV